MKKTLIALLALSGVACGATLQVTFDNCNQSTVSGVNVNISDDAVTGDLNSIKTVTGNTDVTLQTANAAGTDATIITPNTNVGNGSPWVAEFTFTDVNEALTSLDSINLDFVLFDSSGAYQTNQASWSGSLTFTATITNSATSEELGTFTYTLTAANDDNAATDKIYGIGSDVFDRTLEGSSIDLTGVSSINLKLETSETLSAGTFVGVKSMGLTGNAVVPEPATASLSLLGLAALMIRRRR